MSAHYDKAKKRFLAATLLQVRHPCPVNFERMLATAAAYHFEWEQITKFRLGNEADRQATEAALERDANGES